MSSSNGIINLKTSHTVDETLKNLQRILQARNIEIFTVIDHSGGAQKAGLQMPPTKLVIFGNPKGGTPLMLAAPSVAIDLPLKILVWQDPQAQTWISYNSPQYLKERHGLPDDLLKNIAVIEALATEAAS